MFDYTILISILPLFLLIYIVMNNGYVLKFPVILIAIGFLGAVQYLSLVDALDILIQHAATDFETAKKISSLTVGTLFGGFICTGLLLLSQKGKARKIAELKNRLSTIEEQITLINKELKWADGFGETERAAGLRYDRTQLRLELEKVKKAIEMWESHS
ncbi:hypothetical protein OH456_12465 [Vibrio sp. La 4.2.2]|uniref:hypothetical protein n=1 Tax=Vibrio sp. La 4.2.2 TaxID=2998830 RepID=UPI0022CDE72B|nr:hypothetical protein [Vibrio sp. La 4.2.2]MDA0108974.1 hypothetical protein [Vibrio sp. La 4.2.2]